LDKIAVSFVASTFTVGGSERLLSHLITRLPQQRFRVHLYFLKDPGPVGRSLYQSGVAGRANLQRARYDPGAAIRLARLFRRERTDVVFCLDHHNAMLWGRLAGMIAGVSGQVVASHATGLFGGRKNFRPLDRWLMEFTDRVVALSRAHAQYLVQAEGVDPGRITIIENGIPLDQFTAVDDGAREALREELGLEPDRKVVTMLAALRPEKAHEVFLEAARLLVASGDTPAFLVVGDGPLRQDLEAASAGLGLAGHVHFLGSRDDVAQLLHLSDVLTLPSHPAVETLPLSVMEAMAAGVPVVATRVGSLDEMICDGESGLLIEPGSPELLARALRLVLDRPDRAAAMAAEAKKTAFHRYSVERMVERYAALFESVAGRS
jgi:glycosyltransferase involved in cell wall biosynthesis